MVVSIFDTYTGRLDLTRFMHVGIEVEREVGARSTFKQAYRFDGFNAFPCGRLRPFSDDIKLGCDRQASCACAAGRLRGQGVVKDALRSKTDLANIGWITRGNSPLQRGLNATQAIERQRGRTVMR